ncbi:hypothetical protein CACET_c32870 [Clostridium aceticum]|uniref:DZANK-type domain-containing protein n=1 Tax=Clostridium aceticum TaxID=84022 RepID=A0A0G3WDI2_9CLOT|nr:zinc ribbon domain-containing protein [Clostridium aceticum]AKL96731.1 hypothetical protein CACET_c32870 [Clostridium aceticum]
MPIIACIGISILIYYLLLGNMASKEVEKIYCSKCNNEIDSSYEVCPHCSERLKESCSQCKNKIDVEWRYCPYCGNTKKNR